MGYLQVLCKRYWGLELWLVGIFCFFFQWPVCAQRHSFRIMSYNVENLFDTCHDVRHDDFEFLPQSERAWNSMRYWKKQGMLARTIAAVGGPSPVELVALCEVENDSVVRDLAERTKLRRMGYEYIVTNSPDVRGIDVALLYQPERFRVLKDSAIRIPYGNYGRPTRDILYVSGRLPGADTIDLFVNHWPSRRGGRKADNFRYAVARTVRNFADSLRLVRQQPNIVFVGDFNDEYDSRSIVGGLGAVTKDVPEGDYVILSANLKGPEDISGTYKFRGEWNQLDQVIVSRTLLDNLDGLRTRPEKCSIVALPFLLEKDESRGGVKMNRTYLGPIYHGGTSDHLPLLLEMEW